MQIFAAVLLLLPLATASPFLPRQAATNSTTQLTFTGAGASFSVTAPVDGSTFQVPNAISVDHIAQAGQASCTFSGVDKAQLTVLGANTGATLAPPQQITAGQCVAI
ncbi:hypothetical protein N0V93_002198 [Gnomoniopsis smithogilvyi]|uniref:Uncharacterized protein n=1 Tax=Gnomoniopsis smithogilvyi TaxID=1191159 RepID=A0A9W8YW13_9PEZI|nr:hypothetical protein N0V93_002198 [Gnomoniopsis smithogilvyi]